MKLEEYLGIWQFKKNGGSIPLSYRAICNEIEHLNPEEAGHKIIQHLESENYIETLPNGKRILTESGIKKRLPLPPRTIVENIDDEKPWELFRILCGYYADCVTQSEKTQEYLFENDLNNKYLLPVLDSDWMTSQQLLHIRNDSRLCRPAINQIKARRNDDEDVYIGYPLSVFKDINGRMVYSPILLFPVDVIFDNNDLQVVIRQDEIDINRTWLEYNIPHDEQKAVQYGICFSEGDKTGLLDVASAVQYIVNRFKVDLTPNYLDYSVGKRPRGIANTAALFVGNSLKYSKTLKKELLTIAKQPAAKLNVTALAYVFRDPPLENKCQPKQIFLPLDFLNSPSNFEQHIALDQALNQSVSKITGPPGTGKSQVAVNLIANLVFYGNSVLFTSKNHKAIHAIVDRCNEVLKVSDRSTLSLVQFCSTPDGQNGASWQKVRLDDIIAQLDTLKNEIDFTDSPGLVRKFFDSLENHRDWHNTILIINEARQRLQTVNARLEMIVNQFNNPVQELNREYVDELLNLVRKIGVPSIARKWWQRLFDIILRRKITSFNAEAELRQLIPDISATAKTSERLRERTERLCNDINDYLDIKDEESEILRLDFEIPSETLTQLSVEMLFRKNNLKNTFLFNRIKDVMEVPEDTRQLLKNSLQQLNPPATLPFLTRILNENAPEETVLAQNAFRQFSTFYPAWAATLLSLSKTSPCIAGAFDKVIIDEASQCEIPPMIPALYRAKSVTVIGDPDQFPPVITLREARHAYLKHLKHKLNNLSDYKFDFMAHNAFDVIPAKPLMLREHFRCHADIVTFCNEEYYGNKLKVRTETKHLKFPQNMGFRRALEWRNVTDSLTEEVKSVISLFQDLQTNGYCGTIGIISPLRKVVEKLKQDLHPFQTELFSIEKDINTANGFQGGERDLIIFVLGYTSSMTNGEEWYITSPENRYIFNVAVSRARACLIVVGDRNRASQSQASALRNLAKDTSIRPAKQLSQSPGEEKLYLALCEAGLKPVQQYPLSGRYLDIALIDSKIDVEVDGEGYHLNKYGERKQDDIYRDIQIMANGWTVFRFWYREVRDDLENCVKRVLERITK